jgi:AhpD family alkylhydroperoxidase
MPRLRYIDDTEKTDEARRLIALAQRNGAPDPRVVSIMVRTKAGIAWVNYWMTLLYRGVLPNRLKEMCRILISISHQCGYCSTVRSTVAQSEGLTEATIADLPRFEASDKFDEREKAALRYAKRFKEPDADDEDAAYASLKHHFSDEEIIELGLFCAEVDGVGKFVRSLGIVTWDEACTIVPTLKSAAGDARIPLP